MHLIRKGWVLALAVVMLAGPAIACVAPVAAMIADKCCRPRPMADCGGMQLPSAKSCCSAPATPDQNSLAARTTSRLHAPIVAHISQPAARDIASQTARFLAASGESPPESPPGSISILRI